MRFRLGGIRFELSFYFFALLAVFLVLEPDSAAACGVLAAALHESAHIAAMLLSSCGSVEQVSVGVCGVRIKARINGSSEGWVAVCVAGAAVNLAAAFALFAAASLFNSLFLLTLASSNLCLGALNLLPVEPLDGGQLLRSLLLRTSPERADTICARVSAAALVPLICAGLLLLMRTQYNFSLLLLGLWLLGGVLQEFLFCSK